MHKNRFLDSLSNALPDDRPITCLQLVELADKCPRGFAAITKTYDQDQDADLWREGSSFLKKKSARYLCTSKTEGLQDFVVQELLILNEKAVPPYGYSLINKTVDSDQKAWRKKQICYKLAKRRFIKEAVTDIIICKSKAPEGFSLAGDINGVLIYYKMGNVQEGQSVNGAATNGNSAVVSPPPRPPRSGESAYPNLDSDGDYEILGHSGAISPNVPTRPSRPAPPTPTAAIGGGSNSTTSTLGGMGSALDGVPFILNSKFSFIGQNRQVGLPTFKGKTRQQILSEYSYSFTVERQT